MGKILSFVTLVLVTGAFGVLFFEVTSTLLLPLFLAMVSVIMFRPLHTWFERLLRGRNRVAAVISMITVLLLVIAPLVMVLLLAGNEAAKLIRHLDDGELRDKLERARISLGLDYPHVVEMRFAERSFERLLTDAREGAVASGNPEALLRLHEELQRLQVSLNNEPNSPKSSEAQFMLHALATARAETPGTLAYQQAMELASRHFQEYRIEFLGGATRAVVRNIANPTPEDVREWTSSFSAVTPGWISSYGGRAGIMAGRTVFGIMIFIVTMYFLFADGPRIAKQLMALSPLEERYVEKLLEEFSRVSRAVVAGSVAAALAQGMLAGIGFQIAGLKSVFLLTAITALTAMIPFVGAAMVWLPAGLWLIFIEDRPTAGIVLMIYGASVISTIDNVIKPWVLHDRSAMHPLAALIGVLGGVQALGPTGVFVGPMVIAFLQTLLGLLHRELLALGVRNRKSQQEPEQPAESSEHGAVPVSASINKGNTT
jgi:predicted PurR-regulated permease PerM